MKKINNLAEVLIIIIIISFMAPEFLQKYFLLIGSIIMLYRLYPAYKKAKEGTMSDEDKKKYMNKYNLCVENVERFVIQYIICQMIILAFIFIFYLITIIVEMSFIIEVIYLLLLFLVNRLALHNLRKKHSINCN